jgi:hypothetical protein
MQARKTYNQLKRKVNEMRGYKHSRLLSSHKNNEILSFATTQMELGYIVLSKKSTEKQIISLICEAKKVDHI